MGFLSGIGGIINDITGTTSAQKQNYKQSMSLQKENQAWQTEMANSAHQREVQDLENAGLNPVLSAGGGGADTGSPGGGTVGGTGGGDPISMAGGIMQMFNTTARNRAEINNIETDTNIKPLLAEAEIAYKFASAGNAKAQADYTRIMKDIDAKLKTAQTEKTNAETTKIDKDTPHGGKTLNTIREWYNFLNQFNPKTQIGKALGLIK